MLAALIEVALRSLILALAVWLGLRIFRIHDVVSQRSAWIAVLLGSLLMPFTLPFTSHWHVPSIATIPAPVSLDGLQPAVLSTPWAPLPATGPSSGFATSPMRQQLRTPDSIRKQPRNFSRTENFLPAVRALELNSPSQTTSEPSPPSPRPQISIARLALLTYFVVAAALLLRLLLGFVSAMRLWHRSTPIPPVSDVPFGADLNLRWSCKISAPVTLGSGIVLPASYKSWPREKARVVLAHERTHVRHHDFHLQILASLYAAITWFSPLGWWLKHKLSDLSEAISDRSGLDAASDRSAYAQILLEFAAAPRPTLIGVAMAHPSNISRRIERLLNDSYLRHAFSGGVRTRIAALVAPVILFAAAAVVHVQAATQPNQVAQTPVPAGANLSISLAAPAHPVLRATAAKASGRVEAEIAMAIAPAPSAPEGALQNDAAEPEATFDRNLTFNGKLDLSVGTGSGNITLTRGSANQIHIHGIVKAGHDADPTQVQQVAANPPIEQDGNSIRIGGHQENLHTISISYEIEAPADAELNAATGSGNINDTGVGQDAKLITGSGNVTATGLEGDFRTQTGSGNIAIDSTGQGNAKAQTGSGNIDLNGVHGALQAQTGSGKIKAAGTPSSPWELRAGSGSIELSTGNAPMNLDASVGSGTMLIHFAKETQATAIPAVPDRHHMHVQVNGGGPEVRVETGSGDIRVD